MYKGRYIYPAFPFLPSFNYMNIWKGISSKQAYGVFPFLILERSWIFMPKIALFFRLSLSLSPPICLSMDIQSDVEGGMEVKA